MVAYARRRVKVNDPLCHDQSMPQQKTEWMELRPAGPFARALALALDELIRWTLIAVGAVALARSGLFGVGALLLTILAVYGLYGVAFDMLADGQTPGKRAQRIRVVNADGTRIRLSGSVIRNLLLPVDALPFAYLLGLAMMMVTPRFRRIGDLAAGTVVVYREHAREPWEAADLGCAALHRAPLTLYGAWFATALPVFVLMVVSMWSYPSTSGFLLWWLKPLYERMPMWIVSQRLLGNAPTVLDAMSQWRAFGAGLAPMLTYRRLSPTRSFDAAIDVHEGLRGSRRRGRVALLHQRSGSPALWLTVICAHVEAFLVTGAIVVLLLSMPREADLDWMSLLVAASSNSFDWVSNLVYLTAIGLVGPVYASAGFMLYVNRRSELEGGSAPFS
jgi:uncharacterized RDD family membrane protein YckC